MQGQLVYVFVAPVADGVLSHGGQQNKNPQIHLVLSGGGLDVGKLRHFIVVWLVSTYLGNSHICAISLDPLLFLIILY